MSDTINPEAHNAAIQEIQNWLSREHETEHEPGYHVQRALDAAKAQAVDEEQGRWQDRIDALLTRLQLKAYDGSGCDSGDPLDLTLTEIGQVIGQHEEAKAQADAEIARLREVMKAPIIEIMSLSIEYGALTPPMPEIGRLCDVAMALASEAPTPSREQIRKDHAAIAEHNKGVLGMPQGPCQCPVCAPSDPTDAPQLKICVNSQTKMLSIRREDRDDARYWTGPATNSFVKESEAGIWETDNSDEALRILNALRPQPADGARDAAEGKETL